MTHQNTADHFSLDVLCHTYSSIADSMMVIDALDDVNYRSYTDKKRRGRESYDRRLHFLGQQDTVNPALR